MLGFVGAPWTIATYIVEGGTTRTYTTIKSMCHKAPHILRALLSHLAEAISEYIVYQVESGAHCVQIFDSWGGQLPPDMWELWSKPYIDEVTSTAFFISSILVLLSPFFMTLDSLGSFFGILCLYLLLLSKPNTSVTFV